VRRSAYLAGAPVVWQDSAVAKKKPAGDGEKSAPDRTDPEAGGAGPDGDPALTNYVDFTVAIPVAMVNEIEEYAKFVAKRRYRNVKRTDAIHSLLSYSLRFWRKKYVEGAGAEDDPSLF